MVPQLSQEDTTPRRYVRGRPVLTPAERFWPKVDRSGPWPHVGQHLGRCWLWVGSLDRSGYGKFRVGESTVQAHVFAWEAVNGARPAGRVLDHFACDVRNCVNPAHMKPVTHWENTRRGMSNPAVNARKTHCVHGHQLPEPREYGDGRLRRICDECIATRQRTASFMTTPIPTPTCYAVHGSASCHRPAAVIIGVKATCYCTSKVHNWYLCEWSLAHLGKARCTLCGAPVVFSEPVRLRVATER